MSPRTRPTVHEFVLTISLLLLGILGPALHIVAILNQGSNLLYADITRLSITYGLLAVSAASAAYLALRRGRFWVRVLAAVALLANLSSVVFVATHWSGEMQRAFGDLDLNPIPPGQVGIVVCPMDTSAVAVEQAHVLEDRIGRTIDQAKMSPYMVVRHGYPVKNVQLAHGLGQELRANVVIWANPPSEVAPDRYHVTVLGANETRLSLDHYSLMLLMSTQQTIDVSPADWAASDAADGTSPPIHQVLAPLACGYGLMAVGQPMIAASQFQSVLDMQGIPESYRATLHNCLGTSMLFVERDDLAQEQFQQANDIEPTSEAWVGLGLVELWRDNWSGARFAFDHALAMDPYDSAAYCGQGLVLTRDRSIARAVSVFEQAISLDPYANVPYAFLGMTHELSGDIDSAVDAYKEAAIQAGPNVGLQLAVSERSESIQRNPPTAVPTATPIPMPTVTPIPTSAMYVVQSGDTLQGIATEFEVSVGDIVALNKLVNPNALSVGQLLIIPQDKD